jgi:Holliday junction resolvase-like predicted endonuclease
VNLDTLSTLNNEPVFDLHDVTLVEIAARVKRHYGSRVIANDEASHALKEIFSAARQSLHRTLKSRNSASWTLEAYKQTLLWTHVYRKELNPSQIFCAPHEYAPAGRFGWRYALEHLLPRIPASKSRGKPRYDEISRAFTAIVVMANSAEWSNLIHFFPDIYDCISIDLTDPMGLVSPVLSADAMELVLDRHKYLQSIDRRTWQKYPEMNRGLSDERIRSTLSRGLEESLGFGLDHLDQVIQTLMDEVLSPGYTIVHSGEYLVAWVADIAKLPASLVSTIVNFMLLSASSISRETHDFLDKKNPARMINYAGVRIDDLPILKSIYSDSAFTLPSVKRARWHLILNIYMVAEWLDTFQSRCVLGQRPDLKSNPRLNIALERIEQYQKRQVFETSVAGILEARGLKCVMGLKKWPTHEGAMKALPCGEIDIIAYHEKSRQLFVIECKAGSPAVDARGWSQQYKDHFSQKKYHQKFMAKIDWVLQHREQLFRLNKLNIEPICCWPEKIVSVLVTKFPSIVRFYASEYEVKTFVELDQDLESMIGCAH